MSSKPGEIQEIIKFGNDFELDFHAYELRQGGRALKLEPTPMDLLLLLLEQRGRVVTRDQIIGRIWGKGVFVDTDNSINGAIRKIRQVLKDDAEEPRYIQTVTGRGYRFIAPITQVVKAEVTTAQTIKQEDNSGQLNSPPAGPRQKRTRIWHRRWIWLSIAAAVLAAGLTAARFRSSRQPQTPRGRVMLAVLPFENLTGDASQEYFSDGLTEEIITRLASLDPQHLGVIARTSVMHYKNTRLPWPDRKRIGNSVRRRGQRPTRFEQSEDHLSTGTASGSDPPLGTGV